MTNHEFFTTTDLRAELYRVVDHGHTMSEPRETCERCRVRLPMLLLARNIVVEFVEAKKRWERLR